MTDDENDPTTEEDRPGVAGASESGPGRFILCPHCREFVEDENEPDRVVMGHIKAPDVSCDRCGEPLPVGSGAAAVTFYERPEDYDPWEHEYLASQ
jgi:hypothetical protein